MFHNHMATWPTTRSAAWKMVKTPEMIPHAIWMAIRIPFHAGVMTLFHNHRATVPIALNAACKNGTTDVDSHVHTTYSPDGHDPMASAAFWLASVALACSTFWR